MKKSAVRQLKQNCFNSSNNKNIIAELTAQKLSACDVLSYKSTTSALQKAGLGLCFYVIKN